MSAAEELAAKLWASGGGVGSTAAFEADVVRMFTHKVHQLLALLRDESDRGGER